ncbi:transcobalamin-2 [Hemicordylus capensis]|uniref:transcobalamin-2 n=1 Tax=Hemicordylus capensis TaxID=884348 RepID=UPI0023036710|nr:transcobalamin-2 [Hemicordylus capensis]XP_053135671.1 transcobalamin-2 [Hemicordylus capensis]XP_053135672.1 transcobalamin-2 [Hemicordylus capensis]XP_053135673.1 transcobalamin-2 [Hemicordylus capensis]
MDPRGPRFFLLHLLFASVQLCEIPGNHSNLIESLTKDLLRLTEDVSEEPNPSVYLGLRLSANHSLERESRYFQRLWDVFQPHPRRASTLNAVSFQEQPNTGLLALYLLALRAACHNMETVDGRGLVTQLKLHLHKEKQQIGPEDSSRPITSYYQYGLGVLALCVHNKQVDAHVIRKLLNAEKHDKFKHDDKLSVDTEAMAGLAFFCLGKSTFYSQQLLEDLGQAVQRVKQKIFESWDENPDAFGNIYSSPLAVQFLIAEGTSKDKPECSRAVGALLESLERGGFRNTLVGSQLLPALNGRSYVDIASMECKVETGTGHLEVNSLPLEPGATGQGVQSITVHLMVKRPPRRMLLYNGLLQVPLGSSLLDVLKAAERGLKPFTFETQQTLSGPLLTAVMGVKAQPGERHYWKLLRYPNTKLEQGIADYIPADRESILLKFGPW